MKFVDYIWEDLTGEQKDKYFLSISSQRKTWLVSLREGKILSAKFKSLPEQRDGEESGFSLTQTDYHPNWNISNFKYKKNFKLILLKSVGYQG